MVRLKRDHSPFDQLMFHARYCMTSTEHSRMHGYTPLSSYTHLLVMLQLEVLAGVAIIKYGQSRCATMSFFFTLNNTFAFTI